MNKKKILENLQKRIQDELEKATSAYKTTHNHATNEELKSDGKYDTRAIEAGYLAGAQKKRVEELKKELKLLREIDPSSSHESVCIGSIVTLTLNNIEKKYFISCTTGGSLIDIEGEHYLVVSAYSPLCSAMVGLQTGDTFEVEVGDDIREYTITDIY